MIVTIKASRHFVFIPLGLNGLQVMVGQHELTSREAWLAVHSSLVEDATDTSSAESLHC
jgi:hypothetical protein